MSDLTKSVPVKARVTIEFLTGPDIVRNTPVVMELDNFQISQSRPIHTSVDDEGRMTLMPDRTTTVKITGTTYDDDDKDKG